jgi:hypothetical protein
MPLSGNITSKEAPGPKFTPTRASAGMTGQTAPIPGMAETPAPGTPPGEQQQQQQAPEGGEQQQQGQEGEQKRPDGWRLAKVAEKERLARERISEAKTAEANARKALEELEQRRGAVGVNEEQDRSFRRDPEALLRHFGYNPEGVLQFLLNGRQLTPEQKLAADFDERLRQTEKKAETRIEEIERKAQEARQKEDEEENAQELRQEQERTRQVIADTYAEIEDVVKASNGADFPLVKRAIERGRGLDAVYEQLQFISDEQYKETGRRPPITTRLYEMALKQVEEAAREELRETVGDPGISRALGFSNPPALPPRRPTTLPSNLRGRGAPAPVQDPEPPVNETEAQKRARVLGQVDRALKAGRITR